MKAFEHLRAEPFPVVFTFTPLSLSLAALSFGAGVVRPLCRGNSFHRRARKTEKRLSPILALRFSFDPIKEGTRKGFDLREDSEVIEKSFRQLLPEDWLV